MARKTFFIDQGEFLGGAERFLLDFFAALNDNEIRKIRPTVCGLGKEEYRTKLPESIAYRRLVLPSVRGRSFGGATALWDMISCARALAKHVKEADGDDVQFFTNTPRAHMVLLIGKAFGILRGRWVAMFHDFTTPPVVLRRVATRADILVANSLPTRHFLRTHIAEEFFGKIRIVENGVNMAAIPEPSPPKAIHDVLILGRIDPRRGQLDALRAADLLQERNPELHFHVVGSAVEADGSTTSYAREMRGFATARELRNVTFTEEVADPFSVIEKCDMLINLPTEPETFGRTVVEALALGKMVVAYDQTGPKEVVRNFEAFCDVPEGTLRVEANNPMSLAEKIGYFADHPEQLEAFTSRGRAFVEKNYPLTETKKRLVDILSHKEG